MVKPHPSRESRKGFKRPRGVRAKPNKPLKELENFTNPIGPEKKKVPPSARQQHTKRRKRRVLHELTNVKTDVLGLLLKGSQETGSLKTGRMDDQWRGTPKKV